MIALVVGSSIVDVFLDLNPSEKVTVSDSILSFHLGDKIPLSHTSFEAGGNGANVAVALTHLGVPSSFYTYLASDALSSYLKSKLSERGVSIVSPQENAEKSPVSIVLNLPKDRVILSFHPETNHTFEYTPENNSNIKVIYLTSISNRWEDAYDQVLRLSQNNSIPLAFSPGSKQMENINESFRNILRESSYLFINMDEARKILQAFGQNAESPQEILSALAALGPRVVSVTDGGNGSYAMLKDMPPLYLSPFGEAGNEKTGAGDSYAAGFLAGLLHNERVENAMRWGALNAHFVMQIPGAQNGLLNLDEIRTLCDENDSFQPKILE